jgi:hypothetical protein
MNYASYIGVGVYRDGARQLVAVIRLGHLMRDLRDLYPDPAVCRAAVLRLRELSVAAAQVKDVTAYEDRERGLHVITPGAIWRTGQRRKLRTIGALSGLTE